MGDKSYNELSLFGRDSTGTTSDKGLLILNIHIQAPKLASTMLGSYEIKHVVDVASCRLCAI